MGLKTSVYTMYMYMYIMLFFLRGVGFGLVGGVCM